MGKATLPRFWLGGVARVSVRLIRAVRRVRGAARGSKDVRGAWLWVPPRGDLIPVLEPVRWKEGLPVGRAPSVFLPVAVLRCFGALPRRYRTAGAA